MVILASDFGSGDVFWSLLLLSVFLFWVWLTVTIIANVLQQRAFTGTTKAIWITIALLIPFLGTLTYVALHGDELSKPPPPNDSPD